MSTDYDTSDRLYFEPLTLEDVLEVIHAESQSGMLAGVVVQLGGQTALGLAQGLKDAGVTILGTSPEAIDLAEDRGAFSRILDEAGLTSPRNATAIELGGAVTVAAEIGYPVLVRPSFVLGGRAMEVVFDAAGMADYFARNADQVRIAPRTPLLIDRFLDDAIEIDIDALYDGEQLYVGGIMEHIEEAGVHSGDSACALPPVTLGAAALGAVRAATESIAHGVGVRGLINVQFAIAQRSSTSSRRIRGRAAPCRSSRRRSASPSRRPPRSSWSVARSRISSPTGPSRRRTTRMCPSTARSR